MDDTAQPRRPRDDGARAAVLGAWVGVLARAGLIDPPPRPSGVAGLDDAAADIDVGRRGRRRAGER